MGDIKPQIRDYLVLCSILALIMVAFIFFGYDRHLQATLVVLASVFYFFWGIVHHYLAGDLCLRVAMEYLVVAFFACVMVLGLLARV